LSKMSKESEASTRNVRGVILLIENDDNDVFIFRRALATAGYNGDVHVVGSATEARSYLEHREPFRDKSYFRAPHLLVSDYRLCGHTAMEFVRWLKSESDYRNIPILIISGALRPSEGEKLKEVGAVGFLPKTGDVPAFAELLRPYLSLA
jgi:CheY-like chemotaxis protein